jgi:hypothetical protein
MATPTSISPGSIRPAPMAHTAILPASLMNVRPQSSILGLNWTQIPGAASSAFASPDGSLWVLSNLPAGADKYIWHYFSGTWTNISGLASQLAVARNGTLYAINSGGGTYSYSGGTWTARGGGASGVTTAADGSFYVLSNGGSGPNRAIWHNVGGTWSQVPGSGVSIAGSFDTGTYTLPGGTVSPGGLYIVNSVGSIYYENTGVSFVRLPANASVLAPTTVGGVFALGYPANAGGNNIYYYNLSTPGWSAQSGAGVSISSSLGELYVISSSGGIYDTPVATPLHLYVGDDNTPGVVAQFDLPLTARTTTNFSIASNNVVAVAVDAFGNLAVGDNAGHLQFFTAPLSNASTPAAAFNNGTASNNGQIAFTNAGDFWAADVSNRVYGFTHPFSNASTPSAFVTNSALVSAIGTAFDAAQNLYISNVGVGTAGTCTSGAGTCSDLLVYAPPYTGAPIITPNVASTAYRKIAVGATQLFAASVGGSTGRVDVYNLPITAASVPVFSLVAGVNVPEGLALDPSGNLYIGNLGNSTVTVYSAPIASNSSPTFTLTIANNPFAIFGIAVGK